MSKNIKNTLPKLIIVVGSVLLAFLFFEFAMRIFSSIKGIDFRLYMKELKNSDRMPHKIFKQHEKLLYCLGPKVQALATTSDFSVIYKTNSQGFRDMEYAIRKPADKIRIIALGDSFTFGEGVQAEESYTEILENSFSDLEVINFGVPGYGLDQIVLQFAFEGVEYSPDYAMLFLNTAILRRHSTDIIKNGSVILEDVRTEMPDKNPESPVLSKKDDFYEYGAVFQALDKSFLFSYLHYQFSLFVLKNKLQKDDIKTWDFLKKQKADASSSKKISQRARLLTEKLKDICRQRNVGLIIINIDDEYIDLSFLEDIDENIVFWDLSDKLIQESGKYDLKFNYDPHYNDRTHAFIGKELVKRYSKIRGF